MRSCVCQGRKVMASAEVYYRELHAKEKACKRSIVGYECRSCFWSCAWRQCGWEGSAAGILKERKQYSKAETGGMGCHSLSTASRNICSLCTNIAFIHAEIYCGELHADRLKRPATGAGPNQRRLRKAEHQSYDSVLAHRRNALYRRAAELNAITDCEISIIVISAEGQLSQFSTCPMKKILKQYSKLCQEPHECHDLDSIEGKLSVADDEKVGRRKKGLSARMTSQRPSQKRQSRPVSDTGEEDMEETVEAILELRSNRDVKQKTESSDQSPSSAKQGEDTGEDDGFEDGQYHRRHRKASHAESRVKRHRLSASSKGEIGVKTPVNEGSMLKNEEGAEDDKEDSL